MGDQPAIKARRALQQAQVLEREGRLAEARILCRRALRLQPRYFDALNLAGIIAPNSRDPEQALEFFTLALAQKPASVLAHNLHIGPRETPQPAQTFESGNEALRRLM
jgi:tetratricopeptide (TPR) repeat protein